MEKEDRQVLSQPLIQKHTNNFQLLTVVLLLMLFSGILGYFIGIRTGKNEKSQLTIQPTKAVLQISPTLLITSDTVEYAQDSQYQVYLRYKGDITIPDNASDKTIPTNLVWHPIVPAPATDSQKHRVVFSLHAVDNPVYDFMFVMEWDATHYDLYIHKKDGTTEKLATFDITNKSNDRYNVPKINQISQDGNYVALDMYGCWYCEPGQPAVLLMDVKTKKINRIGQVAYFNWRNNGAYDYKDYVTKPCPTPLPGQVNYTDICPEDPQNIPMKSGQFQ